MEALNNKVLLIGRTDEEGLFKILHKKEAKNVDFLSIEKFKNNPQYMDFFYDSYPTVGDVYVKHPKMEKYILDDPNIELSVYKLTCSTMMHFAALLNADTVTYSVDIIDRKIINMKAKAEAKTPAGEGQLNVENKKESSLHNRIDAMYNGAGGCYKLSDLEYERARKFFEDTPLLRSSDDCRTMLEKRDPRFDNQATRFIINLNQECTIKDDLKAAASLSKLKNISIKANVGVKKDFEHKVVLHFEVRFPEKKDTLE